MIIKRSVLENLDCGKMILNSLSEHLPMSFAEFNYGKMVPKIVDFPEIFQVEKIEGDDFELIFKDMNDKKIMENWNFCDNGFLQMYGMLQLASQISEL